MQGGGGVSVELGTLVFPMAYDVAESLLIVSQICLSNWLSSFVCETGMSAGQVLHPAD